MTDLPEPLTPADCDLRDFAWMPVDIARLFGSEFHALSTDAEWRAGVTLWLKSYQQVPAASLPDDDVALARLAELGRDVKAWRKIKVGALRGWTLCSDGRQYHRTVAEKALEAWVDKLLQRKSSGAGNAKRHGTIFDPAAFDAKVAEALARLEALNPSSRSLGKRFLKAGIRPTAGAPDGVPVGGDEPSGGSDQTSRRDPTGTAAGAPDGVPVGSQQNRTEPTRTNPPSPPSGSPSPKGAEASRGSRIPVDWALDNAGRAFAAEQGLSSAEAEHQAADFRDYWASVPGAKGRKTDWPATWRNRVRSVVERRGHNRQILAPSGPGSRPALTNGSAPERSTSGPASARDGIAAGLAALRRETH